MGLIRKDNVEEYIGVKHLALIKSIKPSSLRPLYFELGNGSYGYSSIFGDIYPIAQCEKLNNIHEEFSIGDVVEVFIKKVSFAQENKFPSDIEVVLD